MAPGRAGSDIELDPGGRAASPKTAAYRAVPASGRGKGVLVIDESGALGDFARDVCDRLARAGFTALAPDLPREGNPERVVEAAVRQLMDDESTDGPRVGVFAFEDGAVRLLACSDAQHRIGCIVDCGGVPATDPGDPEASDAFPRVPTLLLFGEDDPRVEDARRLASLLPAPRLELLPGAGAHFMNPARADRHVAPAAAAAWDAVLAFLEASL